MRLSRLLQATVALALLTSSCGLMKSQTSVDETQLDLLPESPTQVRPLRLTALASDQLAPSFAPDGQSLVYQSNGDGNWELYSISLDDLRFERLTQTPEGEEDPSWTPDGSHILATVHAPSILDAPPRDLCMLSADGEERRVLAKHAADDWFPQIALDGQAVYFVSDRLDSRQDIHDYERESAIYKFDLTTRALEQVSAGQDESMPLLSEAGLVYRNAQGEIRSAQGELLIASDEWKIGQAVAGPYGQFVLVGESADQARHLLYFDGQRLHTLDAAGEAQMHPALSPDKTRLVYAALTDGQYDLYIQDAPKWIQPQPVLAE
jgi:Tol biopolymer transport system component